MKTSVIQVEHLNQMVTLIDAAYQRGAVRGEEGELWHSMRKALAEEIAGQQTKEEEEPAPAALSTVEN